MLLSLFTNSSEFKPIEFKPGFNAIVAERAADSTAQDSRNARGKSTVLMFINYVLAGNRHKSLVPLAEAGWEISLSLEMFGGTVTATRSLDKGGRLTLETDQVAGAIVEPYLVEGSISLEDWKELLGLALFRLEPGAAAGRGSLSVRTLLSYVIRSETPKDPFKFMTSQPAVSSRQHVAFLLGLDWQIVRQLAEINRGLDQIGSISAAARDGLVSTLRLEEDLLLERAALKNEADEWAKQIAGFRILEDPNRLVERADALTAEIALLRDDNMVDIRLRNLYRESLDEPDEQIADSQGVVAALFLAAGAVLAEGFVRRLDVVPREVVNG